MITIEEHGIRLRFSNGQCITFGEIIIQQFKPSAHLSSENNLFLQKLLKEIEELKGGKIEND